MKEKVQKQSLELLTKKIRRLMTEEGTEKGQRSYSAVANSDRSIQKPSETNSADRPKGRLTKTFSWRVKNEGSEV